MRDMAIAVSFALRSSTQPYVGYCTRQAQPISKPGDGHCLLYAVQSSISVYLDINIHFLDTIK